MAHVYYVGTIVTKCFGSINERLSIATQGKKTKKQEEIIKR